VTGSPAIETNHRRQSGPGTAAVVAVVAVGVIAAIAVIGLLIAGLTFLGLAIAFPLALPVAQHYHVAVSVADAALAEQFAPYWWAFGIFSIVSFVAAGFVTVKAIAYLSPTHDE